MQANVLETNRFIKLFSEALKQLFPNATEEQILETSRLQLQYIDTCDQEDLSDEEVSQDQDAFDASCEKLLETLPPGTTEDEKDFIFNQIDEIAGKIILDEFLGPTSPDSKVVAYGFGGEMFGGDDVECSLERKIH